MRQHHHSGRARGAGGWQQAALPDAGGAADWFAGRIPDGWFTGAPAVSVDREEITVIGVLPGGPETGTASVPDTDPDAEPDAGSDPSTGGRGSAWAAGRAARFREETRSERIHIAEEARDRYGRTVSWGVRTEPAGEPHLFTHLAVPVMTRLRQPERQVLDTLVAAGVARSRSDALAWAVRLVGEHTEDWLTKLRAAMTAVDELRAQGPS